MSQALPGDPESAVMNAATGVRCAADAVEPTTETNLDQTVEQLGIGRDEFTSVIDGWPSDPTGGYDLGYHPPDYYHLSAAAQPIPTTALYRGQSIDNFILEADVFVDNDIGVPGGDYRYGLAFRHDNGRYYAFAINLSEQSWTVLKYLDTATSETLAMGTSMAINGQGNTTAEVEDRLTVIANGQDMTFLIDGEIVAHVSDAEFTEGQVGFFAESPGGELGHFHFDRISLQAIDASDNLVVLDSPASPDAVEPTPEIVAENVRPEATVVPAPTVEIAPEPTPTAPTLSAVSSLGMVPVVITGTYQLGDGSQVEIEPFWLDRYELSNFDYSQYVIDSGAQPPAAWPGGNMPDGRGRYPVQGVTWEEANAYSPLSTAAN